MLDRAKLDDGCTGAAVELAGEGKREHFGMALEQRMDTSLQITDAFSMNDADLQNALLLAGVEISQDDLFDLARRKGVQIQHAVDRQRDRLAEAVIRLIHQAWDQLTSGAR